MTKLELVAMLENESFLYAAERILEGEDPRRVLNDERPFVSRYNDEYGRQAVEVFRKICRGEIVVT